MHESLVQASLAWANNSGGIVLNSLYQEWSSSTLYTPGMGVDVLHVHHLLIRLDAKELHFTPEEGVQDKLSHLSPAVESGLVLHLLLAVSPVGRLVLLRVVVVLKGQPL